MLIMQQLWFTFLLIYFYFYINETKNQVKNCWCVVFRFWPHSAPRCVCIPQAGIPKAVRHTISKLAECGWLYNKIRAYVQSRSADKAFGLIGQVGLAWQRVCFTFSSLPGYLFWNCFAFILDCSHGFSCAFCLQKKQERNSLWRSAIKQGLVFHQGGLSS